MESRDDNFMSQMMLGASFGPQNLNFKCITPTCQSYLPTCSWGTITPTPTQPRTLMHGFDVPMPILKYSTVGLLSLVNSYLLKLFIEFLLCHKDEFTVVSSHSTLFHHLDHMGPF